MTLHQILLLSQCRFGRHFLTKSYSLELLLYFVENRQADGIEDLLRSLKSTTPRLPAFLAYISLLEAKGCVTKTRTEFKESKRTIMLTTECENAIRRLLYT